MASNSGYNKNSFTNLSTSTEICYCVCRSSHIDTFMICCDFCEEWFHGECIGVNAHDAEAIEKYFCERCRTSNSNLQITFKRKMATKRKKMSKLSTNSKTRIKHTPKKKSKYENGKIETVSCASENLDSAILEKTQPPVSDIRTVNDEDLAIIFESDTTKRKAKTIANKNIMEHTEVSTIITKHKDPPVLKQCDGPGCTKVARTRSKYCSDACGIKLGRNRILEILPQRLEQRKAVPCAADEFSKRKLAAIRRRQGQLRSSIDQMDVKIVQLLQLVEKAKSPDDKDIVIEDDPLEDENATSLHCKLCGAEVQTRLLVRHMEHCYKKQEKRLMLSGTTKADDLEWNIFCNHKMGKQGFCKQLKATCPFHHRNRPNTDEELCGYPVVMNLTECSGKFCGRLRKNCPKHPKNWEDNFRADMDMQKWKFLWSLNLLEKEEGAIRRDMAKRGNLMALLLHQTIVH
ncbi:hypothetical protein JTE90_023008 [Oedothorax gibbosus]|uniref:CXXC-type zinc finger protein 1 n=1 Tax=Oedothorax gibbosus TaxID=931172 RepID=A0AAV6UC51_9ARAC|nr:hypothetical protein JTE90_023008 [Oedothorax gibbosus]